MSSAVRSFNLACSVSMACFEAGRQLGVLDPADLEARAEARGVVAPRGRWDGVAGER